MPIIALFITLLALGTYAFFRLYPPFGGHTKNSKKESSSNFTNGKFVNHVPVSMGMKPRDIASMLRKQFSPHPARRPSRPLTPDHLSDIHRTPPSQPRITWFGHSAFLLQLDGKTILLDPMLSQRASPFQFLGPKRFSTLLPATIDELPAIDMVVISHDHYDHLDYHSIKKLRAKTKKFFVPLGLAAHLRRWGVDDRQIVELDWWQSRRYHGISFVCTPSRHFSGRTLTDRFATLWCSWVIRSDTAALYFSGDGGYGSHFKQIGKKYGPFDLTLLECGQYDAHWPDVHMMPEQTVEAHHDLRGKRMIPIHWGAFALAFHDWVDPIRRVITAGAQKKAVILTPRIGESIAFTARKVPSTTAWWNEYED